MASIVQQFVDSLGRLEREGEAALDGLVSLFTEDATVTNPVLEPQKGREAVKAFWREYRRSFRDVESHFAHMLTDGRTALLEWRTEATTPGGHTFAYAGVTVLELAGDRIRHFRAYYDPAEIRPALAPRTGKRRAPRLESGALH